MTLRLQGTTGFTEVEAPAAAGNNTLTLPTSNGSAEQFLKNSGTAGELEYSSMVETSTGVGIGTSSPVRNLHLATSGLNNAYFHLTHDGTGHTDADGADIRLNRSTDTLDIMNLENQAITFHTNGENERARITHHGRFDVFASSITDSCFVSSQAGAGTALDVIRGLHSATATGTGTTSFAVRTNGNVVNTNNSYGSLSDVKLKENIADASSQWDDIKGLRVRNYNFKEETGNPTHTQLGVVAQEVETVSPGLVYETPDRDSEGTDLGTVTKSVNYSVLYMKAVKALQEAQTRIETLETQNTAQQTQIDDLLARVTALEAA